MNSSLSQAYSHFNIIMIFSNFVFFTALASTANACPFAADSNADSTVKFSDAFRAGLARAVHPHHPQMMTKKTDEEERRNRKLQDFPPLDPSTGPDYGGGGDQGIFYNNAFMNGAGLSRTAWRDPATGESFTIPEIISLYHKGHIDPKGPGVGQDLCYFSFQSLPPPPYLDPSVPVVARNSTENPNEPLSTYLYPKSDLPRYSELADMAVNRLTRMIQDDNPHLLFAGCAAGWTSARALCEVGIDGLEGSYCDEPRANSLVAWPQATSIFKIDPDNTDAFHNYITQEWRDSPGGHLPNIWWTFAGGSNKTMDGNEEYGGITPSIEQGWGANGGLRAKIVQCDKIDPKLIRPMHGDTHIMGSDAIDEETGRTWGELAYNEWDRLCGIPLGEATSDCVIDADMPGDDTSDMEEVSYAMLRFDETCIYESKYIADSTACGSTNLDEAWGNHTKYEKFEEKYNEMVESCGVEFCASLNFTPSDGTFGLDENGFAYCAVEGYRGPTQCDEGIKYMESLAQYVDCTVTAGNEVSLLKKQASENAASVANKAASESCQNMIKCEEDALGSITDDWSFRFCQNFFVALLDPAVHPNDEYKWVENCQIGPMCSQLFTGIAKDDAATDTVPAKDDAATDTVPAKDDVATDNVTESSANVCDFGGIGVALIIISTFLLSVF